MPQPRRTMHRGMLLMCALQGMPCVRCMGTSRTFLPFCAFIPHTAHLQLVRRQTGEGSNSNQLRPPYCRLRPQLLEGVGSKTPQQRAQMLDRLVRQSSLRGTPLHRMSLQAGDDGRLEEAKGDAGGEFKCELLNPECYREVNAFYKANGYRATSKATDVLWVIKHRTAALPRLLGAVRLTPQRYKPFGGIFFLRSLCIAKDWRRRGLGTMLTRAATAYKPDTPRYCFALTELVPLYLKAGWAETRAGSMPRPILSRFEAVADQTARKHKSVALLSHGLPAPLSFLPMRNASEGRDDSPAASQTRIVLIQHVNEGKRETATAQVLEHDSLAAHIWLERWVCVVCVCVCCVCVCVCVCVSVSECVCVCSLARHFCLERWVGERARARLSS